MRLFKTVGFVVLILSLVIVNIPVNTIARSQDNDFPPPQVIDLWPVEGVDLGATEPIVVSFDQPMNKASVEDSLAVTPSVKMRLDWLDAQTINVSPVDRWPTATNLTLAIETGATAQTGKALESRVTMTLHTAASLKVAYVTPGDKLQQVITSTKIRISFDRPVVPLTSSDNTAALPMPLIITPPVSGKGEWENTSLYVFTPEKRLLGGTSYEVTVPKGLTAADGTQLEADYKISFKTQLPQVDKIEFVPLPSDPARKECQYEDFTVLDCAIVVRFSEAMDRASTEKAFTMREGVMFTASAPTITGTFAWFNDDTVLRFTPSERLHLETNYHVTVSQDAYNRSLSSSLSRQGVIAIKTVPKPGVESPPLNEHYTIEAGTGMRIQFRSLMKTDTIKSRLSITPMPEAFIINDYSYYTPPGQADSIYMSFDGEVGTTYTITLPAGAEDIYGNTIDDDLVFSFTVTQPKVTTRAYPLLTGGIMTTRANKPQLDVFAVGKGTMKFAVYRLNDADLNQFGAESVQYGERCMGGAYGGGIAVDNGKPKGTLVRQWEVPFDETGSAPTRMSIPVVDMNSKPVQQGIYLIRMLAPGTYFGQTNGQMNYLLLVSSVNITLKRTKDRVFVWVTDMLKAEPLTNFPVNMFYRHTDRDGKWINEQIDLGKTDQHGIINQPLALTDNPYDDQYISVVADSGTVFGAWYSCLGYSRQPDSQQNFLYTDRPIYRPGDTVYVKGILRNRTDMTYTPRQQKTAYIRVYASQDTYRYDSKPIFETNAPVNANGSFTAEFALPGNVALGNAVINLGTDDELEHYYQENSYSYSDGNLGQVYFKIAAFRPPEFAVAATTPQTELVQGESFAFDAAATYYSGGNVGNAPLKWQTFIQPSWFNYTGKGQYSFYDERWPYYYAAPLDEGETVTDALGKVSIVSQKTLAVIDPYNAISDGLGSGTYRTRSSDEVAPGKPPVTVFAEATLTDEAGQPVSSRTKTVVMHPANVYVGIDMERWGAENEKPLPIHLITVTPKSAPIAGQHIDLTIHKFTWKYLGTNDFENPQWTRETNQVDTTSLTTAADGTVTYTFMPKETGVYRVEVQTADDQGRIASATSDFYISGYAWTQWNDPQLAMQPEADKTEYLPGETATINVPLGFAGRSLVLVTVERANVITSEVVEANGPVLTYKLPIDDSYAPGAYVYFTAYRGVDAANPEPDYRGGEVQIRVQPVARRLNVTLTPSTTNTTPGGKVSFNVRVTDANGQPVKAEVGLALVDKSVLALVRPNSPSLEQKYYDPDDVYNYVHTNLSMYGYIPLLKESYIVPCCFGGGGGGPFELSDLQDYMRTNFKFTAAWEPFVMTDENGQAEVSVMLPDNATTWQLDARAITTDTRVGEGRTELIATLPLLIRPVAPRFLVAGDKVQLAAVINNNSNKEQNATVSLIASGVTLIDSAVQRVDIPASGRARVTWNVTVDGKADTADLVFDVQGQDGYRDAARPLITAGKDGLIPIYQYVAYEAVATSGSLFKAETNTEAISIPGRFDGKDGQVNVKVEASLAGASIDALKYLMAFPHDCIEQTTSKLLPNVYTLRALRALNINDPTLEKGLDDAIRTEIDKLRDGRASNGGWSWFPSGTVTDPLVTAYAMLGLMETSALKYDGRVSDTDMYLVNNALVIPSLQVDTWKLNRQAFYLYVLARYSKSKGGEYLNDADQKVRRDVKDLFAYRTRLNNTARAFLLMAFYTLDPASPEIAELVADLESAAISTPTTTNWGERVPDWYNWGTDTRTTAIVLSALIQARPESPLLAGAVRWLMLARRFDHWETTQETAWSVRALTDWMVFTKELEGNYTYTLAMNGSKIETGTVTPATVRETHELQLDVSKLLAAQLNRFTATRSEGDGALYYTLQMKVYGDAKDAQPVNRGISINREYFLESDNNTPVTQAKLGDVINVKLTFDVAQDMNYVVIEDPFPAGVEGIDTSLLTTSVTADAPDFERVDTRWYWGWWYINRTEMRDQQFNIYASNLPRGVYTFTYQVRATVAGEFQVMPARGYPFYIPGVFGRSDGVIFIIHP